ncbi:hypothetical protein LQ318_14835 [Aliifodinibius salicampi]|uniref:Uncharacterized protein n=1 Tax=Fodinibius salicampi TaxID=1920655 RepID=A0ABT3Q251_9BACT|nr:hypothetical protein [Fodinibius salicampi]MCW9714184.1 hypothetical protein [Fodinibius salicampi]
MNQEKKEKGMKETGHRNPDKDKISIPCCPELKTDEACDIIDFQYRTVHNAQVSLDNTSRRIPVEVIIKARLERCTGPLALGDLVYTNTLYPGEKVRLFSIDRRSRFSYDSSTNISYRHEQTSEERYYMSSMSDFMSDLSIRNEGSSSNKNRGSTKTSGGTSGPIETFFSGPSVDIEGSYDAESTSTFLRELNQHVESSHHSSVQATRTASSVSVGEVNTRSHAEGETEDHFESSSRVFSNPNHCHAITYYFYQINKTQTIKFTIESIRRRVIDPAANTKVANNPFISRGDISVIPNSVLATDENRLSVERRGRESVSADLDNAVRLNPDQRFSRVDTAATFASFNTAEPLSPSIRAEALAIVDRDLVNAGLLKEEGGDISEETRQKFSFELTSSLPTPGLFVRSCLDECNICEPAVMREIQLDLEYKKLQNKLLERQIELLEKSQEYRCCPADEEESEDDDG